MMASPQILVEVNLVVGDYSPAFTVSDGGPESRLLSLRAPVPSVTQVSQPEGEFAHRLGQKYSPLRACVSTLASFFLRFAWCGAKPFTMSWQTRRTQLANISPSVYVTKKLNHKIRASLDEAIHPRGRSNSAALMAAAAAASASNAATAGQEESRRLAMNESRRAVTSFMSMYLLVSAAVALAWLLGTLGCSFLWVFLSIGALFAIWKAKIGRIIAQHLNYQEAILYRKRAFRQDETAEWFNFMLNRW
ncbi:hypothetical protein RRG08_042712 [Elysia crispata]|uniref:Uncharacterized protein n=1 Tax=Elysia crispata TaxID=231223 RepID=A0AAE1CKH2_9GAST|nr:hypothetical protein RRG08_042712 [Elysia crispata]